MKKGHLEVVRATKAAHTKSKKHLKRIVSDTTQANTNQDELQKLEKEYEKRKQDAVDSQVKAINELKLKIQQCNTGKIATHGCVVLASDTDSTYANGVPLPLSGLVLDLKYYLSQFKCTPLENKTKQEVLGRHGNVTPVTLPGRLRILDSKGKVVKSEPLCIRWKCTGVGDDVKYETRSYSKALYL